VSIGSRLRQHAVGLLIAVGAIAIVIGFASTTIRLAGRVVLPVDDGYLALACADRVAGACAQTTSVVWPGLLALPSFVTDGYSTVTIAFGLCAVLFVIACASAAKLGERLHGAGVGVVAGVATLAIAPFAFGSLAGLEVALTAALLVGCVDRVSRIDDLGPPSRVLAVGLALLGLARPEARVVLAVIVVGAVHAHVRANRTRDAVWWLVPAIPSVIWLVLGDPFGHRPSTPDLETMKLAGAPLAYLFAALWLVGAVRCVWWARASRRTWVGALVVGAPVLYHAIAMLHGTGPLAIAPAVPLFAVTAGCAAMPVGPRWIKLAVPAACVLALAITAFAPMRSAILSFAQDAADLDRRVARLAIRAREMSASGIAAHDAGTAAFWSGTHVLALDAHGDTRGERFERLEQIADPPQLFLSSALALGTDELFGDVHAYGTMGGKLAPRRSWTRGDVVLADARWDHVRTAERPLSPHPGWRLVDRIDLADRDSEKAHHWADERGVRDSLIHREAGAHGLLIDGGRTLREQRFEISIADPAKPVRLVLRTGGHRQYPDHEPITQNANLVINNVRLDLPAPRGVLLDLEIELRAAAHAMEITVEADRSYRAFHWFVLQPY
jgi:hypothetical protein